MGAFTEIWNPFTNHLRLDKKSRSETTHPPLYVHGCMYFYVYIHFTGL